jgi:hypothetical protein
MNRVTYYFTVFFLPKSCGDIIFWIKFIFYKFALELGKLTNSQKMVSIHKTVK